MFWSSTLKSISDSITSIVNYLTVSKDKQLETEIVKEKKSLKKASNISEKMFKIVLKYIDTFEEKDKKRIEKLYDDFLEKN
jgi:phosphate uptake regulator